MLIRLKHCIFKLKNILVIPQKMSVRHAYNNNYIPATQMRGSLPEVHRREGFCSLRWPWFWVKKKWPLGQSETFFFFSQLTSKWLTLFIQSYQAWNVKESLDGSWSISCLHWNVAFIFSLNSASSVVCFSKDGASLHSSPDSCSTAEWELCWAFGLFW